MNKGLSYVESANSIFYVDWKITNIYLLKDRMSVKSTYFFIDSIKFELKLKCHFDKEDCDRDVFEIRLWELDVTHNMKATVNTYIRGSYGDKHFQNTTKITGSRLQDGHQIWKETRRRVLEKDPYLKEMSGQNEVLTITCRIELHKDIEYEYDESKITQQENSSDDKYECLDALYSDFKKFFQDGLGTDIELMCGSCSFRAHKSILQARSKLLDFKAHRSNTEEIGMLEIEDFKPHVLMKFLHFLYCGTLPSLDVEDSIELFDAGLNYEVDALPKICLKFLQKNLSRENACSILKLFERYGKIEDAESDIISFVKDNEDFFTDEDWIALAKDHYEIAYYVYSSYFK